MIRLKITAVGMAMACAIVGVSSIAASARAEAIAAHGTITGANGPLSVDMRIDDRQRATVRIADAAGRQVEDVRLLTNADVIPLLIDRRFAFLWPTLTGWAGPALDRLRARMLADSASAFARGRTAYGTAIASNITGKAAANLEHALILKAAGHPDKAIAVLRDATDAWPQTKAWGRTEQSILLVSLAGRLAEKGHLDDADRLLATAPDRLGPGGHQLNIMVSRASLLALGGRYREALEIVDPTAQAYAAKAGTIGGMLNTIPGSQRYFASIRACALAGLGRSAEAEAALAPVLGTREPGSILLKVVQTNSEIRLRTFACMRDRTGFAHEIVANLADDPVSPAALALMQPMLKAPLIDPALLQATRADPQVIAALAAIARPLPPELVPALNDWGDRP